MSPRIRRPAKSPRVQRLRPDMTPAERAQRGFSRKPEKARSVPALPIRLSCPPQELQWFALTVQPQSERIALGQLQQRGFDAFLPVERVESKLSRRQKYQRVQRERPMLPSILLVGFPLDEGVPWLDLWDVPRVTGVIGMADRPVRLQLVNVVTLMLRSGGLSRTRNWTPALRDVVEVAEGAWAGFEGRVVQLKGGRAMVELFGIDEGLLAGRKTALTVPEGWLVEADFAAA